MDPCRNGGRCQTLEFGYKCDCRPGFTGMINFSLIVLYSSVLFSGENCEINIDDCEGIECLHDGKCVDGVNEYKCECIQGYEGSNCKYPTNECEGVQCQNGGKCFDGHNEYFCQCKYGFTGTYKPFHIHYPWLLIFS